MNKKEKQKNVFNDLFGSIETIEHNENKRNRTYPLGKNVVVKRNTHNAVRAEKHSEQNKREQCRYAYLA